MLNDLLYTPSKKEEKINGPSRSVVDAVLQYSKSLEVKKAKQKKILIHLN